MILINLLSEKSKVCSRCKEVKILEEFSKRKNVKDGRCSQCKQCDKQYRQENSDKMSARSKRYRQENLDECMERVRRYQQENREKLREKCRQYYRDNSDKLKEQNRQYRQKNRDKINVSKRKWSNNKRRTDPVYKLSRDISSEIRKVFRSRNSSKNASIFKYLSYSILQLKEHLEKLFEPWMNWENHGSSKIGVKTWHIDHIEPQSKLPYDSMEHPNFQKCWALENLRPLEAFANLKKGNKVLK